MTADSWHDKIASTLITVALTALGAIAFQSIKYVTVDYSNSLKASGKALKATLEAHDKFLRQWSVFDKTAFVIIKTRTPEREDLLLKARESLGKDPIKEVKIDQVLLEAYKDLGAVSYVPVGGASMQSERETLVALTKSQIDGLEIVERWQAKGHLGLTERMKAWEELGRNERLRAEAITASLSADGGLRAELDEVTKENQVALENYNQESKERQRWLIVYTIAGILSTVIYVRLLSYLTSSSRSKPPVQESPKEKSAGAP